MPSDWIPHGGGGIPSALYPDDEDERQQWPECFIRYRNGDEIGPIDPRKRRWKAWPWGESEWDIVAWRKS